jgi:hypothetical protein
MHQRNRTEDQEISSGNGSHQILTKVPKAYAGEKKASSTQVAGKSGYLHAEKVKLDPCLSPCTNINSK